MFYNHLRRRVSEWDGKEPSLCPECKQSMIAKAGEIVSWHWAHKSFEGCSNIETPWHITWKLVYLSMPGWEIEYPIEIEGKSYRLDAYNPKTLEAKEFVHCISDSYYKKHWDLLESDHKPEWIWDGNQFRSKYLKWHNHGPQFWFEYGIKPAPLKCYSELGGYLHFNGFFWEMEDDNKWNINDKWQETKPLCSEFERQWKLYAKKRVFQEVVGVIP